MSLGIPSDDFYRLREDRTLRSGVDPVYQRRRCLVVSDAATVETFAGQLMVLTTLTLLGRWCRRVDVLVPDTPLHERLQHLGERLHGAALSEMRGADPYGTFRIVDSSIETYDLSLKVGSGPTTPFIPVDFTIDSDGWTLCIFTGNQAVAVGHRSLNPCGPVAASAVGVAQLFKKAIGLPRDLWPTSLRLSLFDFRASPLDGPESHPEPPSEIDLGRSLMVGAGMLGSSTLYLLRTMRLAGALSLIDHDIVKMENLNRSPMLRFEMVGLPKAEAGAAYMQGSGMAVIPYVGTYDEYIRDYGRRPNSIDLVFPLANEFNVRQAIEHNYPPLMIYGTTTMDWGANFGRHIPLKEDCLSCRYPNPVADPTLACGQGTVTLPDQVQPVDVALPFVPIFSAAMLVAEVLKSHIPGYPHNGNFAFVDLKGDLTVIDHRKRVPTAGCVCTHRHTTVFAALNGETRFASLSL